MVPWRNWIGSLLAGGLFLGAGGESLGQGATTSLFQKGVSPSAGYVASQDSTLRSLTGSSFGMQSLGRDESWNPRWPDSEGAGLLWFDVSSIPAFAIVSTATVRIWFEPDEFEETSGHLALYRLGDRDETGMWLENTNAVEADYGTADPSNAFGCAAYKRPSVMWTEVGGRVTDVTGGVARAWHEAGTAEWIEFEVTEGVQDFVLAPSNNLGWLAMAEVENTLRGELFTGDAPTASHRPQLEVVYVLPDEVPPTADAGGDQWLEAEAELGWALATVDGSGSSDADGTIDAYVWTTGGVEVASGAIAQMELPVGTHGVTLTVTDDDGLTDTDTVQIVVALVSTNEPPVLAAIGNRTAWAGYELRFSLNATDPDGDSVIFTASNLPTGATFLPPQFSWTPTAGQTGLFSGIEFWGHDGNGGVDSEAISITVREPGAGGTTWYVRVDGGSAEECTGLVDAPYPGSGTNQPCAWDHPFQALPPGGAPRLAGGDTLLIGPGSYRMGHGAPGAEACSSDAPWDCRMPPIPSGPNPENPTRILGADWATGCTNKPALWGAERAFAIVDLTDATHVEIGCLELLDHEGCVEFHSGGIPCPRETFPYGDWAARAIYAEDAERVHLHDLDIHGMANTGIQAGRLTDWTVANVRVAGNGWAGWDGDIAGDDGNSGTLSFTNFTVEWNGCGESYPGGQPTGCWAQTAGGYGDGMGTGETGGNWVFDNCRFLHNTSDGLDLLYVTRPGSAIAIRRTWAEGNAGNQLKTAGPARIENCVVVGNCGYFDGQPFTYFVDPCRALGNTLSLALGAGDQAEVVNSTITGEGDCLVLANCLGSCDGTEGVWLRNNVFIGATDYHQPFENTCLTYGEGFPSDPFDLDYSVIETVKGDACPVGPHDICGNANLTGMTLDAFDARPLSNSLAIDAGVDLAEVGEDFAGVSRPLAGGGAASNRWDIGAVEYIWPLADSDGDGFIDADEAVAGTDATNGASWLALGLNGSGAGPRLSWWGMAGRRYDLEYAVVATGEWGGVVGATNVAGTNGMHWFTNAVPETHRFFRLRAVRP